MGELPPGSSKSVLLPSRAVLASLPIEEYRTGPGCVLASVAGNQAPRAPTPAGRLPSTPADEFMF